MTANTQRVHPSQASTPWTEAELAAARQLAALEVVPTREIIRLFPNRSISSVKTKIYSLRTGRGASMSNIRIDGAVTLHPDDPGMEDRDSGPFNDMVRDGSMLLLRAIQRAGLSPA